MRAAVSSQAWHEALNRPQNQRSEHHEESKREERNRTNEHKAERLKPEEPPWPRLDEPIGAIEADPERFDCARGEIERQDRAKGQEPSAGRSQDVRHLPGDRAGHLLRPFREHQLRRLTRQLGRTEETGERGDKDEKREQRSQQRQANVARDGPTVVGAELLRGAPKDRCQSAQCREP